MTKLMPGVDVWFRPGVHELQLLSDQPLAAKVTYVHHSGLVNLIVWGKGGESFQRASTLFWDGDGDAPDTNHASWVSEDDFEVIERPTKADVTRHPFEGRPSGGQEDLDRARVAQSALDARGNMDHGPPRSWGQSPNAGGPLAIDDHKPHPFAKDPVAQSGSEPPANQGNAARFEAQRSAKAQASAQASASALAELGRAEQAKPGSQQGDGQAAQWNPNAPPYGDAGQNKPNG